MISLTASPKAKLLAIANLVLATACLVVIASLFIAYYRTVHSGKSYDPEVLIGPYLAVLVFFPLGALLCTAAAAHWARWPGRWIVQGLVIVIVTVLLVLLGL